MVVYGEADRNRLYINTFIKCIKFWLHIFKLPLTRLCRHAYEMVCQQHESGKLNWITDIKRSMYWRIWVWDSVGKPGGWEFKDCIICSLKQNTQTWRKKKNKCLLSFKDNLQSEKYISVINIRWYRSTLARLQTRTLVLNASK